MGLDDPYHVVGVGTFNFEPRSQGFGNDGKGERTGGWGGMETIYLKKGLPKGELFY